MLDKITITKVAPVYRVVGTLKGYDKTWIIDEWNVEYDFNGEKRASVVESAFVLLLSNYEKHNVYNLFVNDSALAVFGKDYGEFLGEPKYEDMGWYKYELERIEETIKYNLSKEEHL